MRLRAALTLFFASAAVIAAVLAVGRWLSPMSDVLAYASDNDIRLADVTRGLTHNLTDDDDRIVDNSPSWSPDGRSLVFATVRGTPNSRPQSEIALLEIATREVVLLTDTTSWDDSPAWSPDGRWIAFRSDRDTHAGMGVYLIDMTRPFDPPRLLVRDLQVDLIPSWSPDSASVVMTLTIGDNTQVVAVDIDSGTGTQILPRASFYPKLSPDGTRLAAWVPAVDGYALAAGLIGETLTAISRAHLNPSPFSWSPDSTGIAYGSTENARNVIRRVDVETGEASVLLTAPAYIAGISWRP